MKDQVERARSFEDFSAIAENRSKDFQSFASRLKVRGSSYEGFGSEMFNQFVDGLYWWGRSVRPDYWDLRDNQARDRGLPHIATLVKPFDRSVPKENDTNKRSQAQGGRYGQGLRESGQVPGVFSFGPPRNAPAEELEAAKGKVAYRIRKTDLRVGPTQYLIPTQEKLKATSAEIIKSLKGTTQFYLEGESAVVKNYFFIPTPRDFDLTEIHIRYRGQALVNGYDFKLMKDSTRGFYWIKFKDDRIFEDKIELSAGWAQNPSDAWSRRDIQIQDFEKALKIADSLRKIGLTQLSDRFQARIDEARRRGGNPIMIRELSLMIAETSLYSFDQKRFALADSEGVYERFRNYANGAGIACMQCDASNDLLKVMLNDYFSGSDLRAEVESVFSVRSDAKELTWGDVHATTGIFSTETRIDILDATATSMELRYESRPSAANQQAHTKRSWEDTLSEIAQRRMTLLSEIGKAGFKKRFLESLEPSDPVRRALVISNIWLNVRSSIDLSILPRRMLEAGVAIQQQTPEQAIETLLQVSGATLATMKNFEARKLQDPLLMQKYPHYARSFLVLAVSKLLESLPDRRAGLDLPSSASRSEKRCADLVGLY